MVAPLEGFFQSFLPVARPMKLSTAMGALSGKRVQAMLPRLVSNTACTGWGAAGVDVAAGLAAGLAAVDFGAVVPDWAVANPVRARIRIAGRTLRMGPPSCERCLGLRVVSQFEMHPKRNAMVASRPRTERTA